MVQAFTQETSICQAIFMWPNLYEWLLVTVAYLGCISFWLIGTVIVHINQDQSQSPRIGVDKEIGQEI